MRTPAQALEEFRQRYRRMKKQLCRHCQKRPVRRPRGLCWQCFYTPEVRALYTPQGPPGDADWPTCVVCGGKTAYADGRRPVVCSTCRRPQAARAGYFHRIARYAAAVVNEEPIPYEEKT